MTSSTLRTLRRAWRRPWGGSRLHAGWDDEGEEPSVEPAAPKWTARRLWLRAAPSIRWFEADAAPVLYTSAGAVGSIGLAFNNAWYATAIGRGVVAVYADESPDHTLHVVHRSLTGSSSAPSTWTERHTTTIGSFVSRSGDGGGYPCIAARVLPTGGRAVAVAWTGPAGQLMASHSRPDDSGVRWAETDVSGLVVGLSEASHPCLFMDAAYNTWLVFQASEGGVVKIFLSVRPNGGEWSAPTQVNDTVDHVDGSRTYTYLSAEFPSIAVSRHADPAERVVQVVYRVQYDTTTSSAKRVLGKAMQVDDVRAAGLDLSGAAEVDIGGDLQRRDPCVVASEDGRFLVFYAAPAINANICSRYSDDPVAGTWSPEVAVSPTSDHVQNYPNAVIDEDSGLCLVTWEESDPDDKAFVTRSYAAYAPLVTPASWAPLGDITGLADPTTPSSYPCVASAGGKPRLFFLAPDGAGLGELRWRTGTWS